VRKEIHELQKIHEKWSKSEWEAGKRNDCPKIVGFRQSSLLNYRNSKMTEVIENLLHRMAFCLGHITSTASIPKWWSEDKWNPAQTQLNSHYSLVIIVFAQTWTINWLKKRFRAKRIHNVNYYKLKWKYETTEIMWTSRVIKMNK
jgi:hypothetical protein